MESENVFDNDRFDYKRVVIRTVVSFPVEVTADDFFSLEERLKAFQDAFHIMSWGTAGEEGLGDRFRYHLEVKFYERNQYQIHKTLDAFLVAFQDVLHNYEIHDFLAIWNPDQQ